MAGSDWIFSVIEIIWQDDGCSKSDMPLLQVRYAAALGPSGAAALGPCFRLAQAKIGCSKSVSFSTQVPPLAPADSRAAVDE